MNKNRYYTSFKNKSFVKEIMNILVLYSMLPNSLRAIKNKNQFREEIKIYVHSRSINIIHELFFN